MSAAAVLVGVVALCFAMLPSAYADEDYSFSWDSGTSTLTLTLNGGNNDGYVDLSSASWRTGDASSKLAELGLVKSANCWYANDSLDPIKYFVIKGTGNVAMSGIISLGGLVGFKVDSTDEGPYIIDANTAMFTSVKSTLESVDFGKSLKVESFNMRVFASCTKLENVDLSECTAIKELTSLASGLSGAIPGTLKLPASLTSLNSWAFNGIGTTSIEFAKGTYLETVSGYTYLFSYGLPLTSVILPASLGDFQGTLVSSRYTSLRSIEMPYELKVPEDFLKNMGSVSSWRITVTDVPEGCTMGDSLAAALEKAEATALAFDTNNGSSTFVIQAADEDGFVAEPDETPTREGYEFTGWYKDEACTQKFDFESTIPTGVTTLYAGWESTQATVTFDSRGGTEVESQTVNKGEAVERPAVDPMYDGYEFIGWYEDEACTSEYDFSKPVDSDLTLYAKWNAVEADDPADPADPDDPTDATDPTNPDDPTDSTDPTDQTGDQGTTSNDQSTTTDNTANAGTASSGTGQTTLLSKTGDDSTLGLGLAGFFAALASLCGAFAYRKCRVR